MLRIQNKLSFISVGPGTETRQSQPGQARNQPHIPLQPARWASDAVSPGDEQRERVDGEAYV